MMFFQELVFLIIWFFACVGFHEIGHKWTANLLGYRAVIKGFSTEVSPDPTSRDDGLIALGGWMLGFVGIVMYVLFWGMSLLVNLLFIFLYFIGTKSDLKIILGVDE